jgi:hypothetical protein
MQGSDLNENAFSESALEHPDKPPIPAPINIDKELAVAVAILAVTPRGWILIEELIQAKWGPLQRAPFVLCLA